MNKRATPFLLLAVLILGGAVWWGQHSRKGESGSAKSKSNRVLAIEPGTMTQVRVRQDYWNSFVLLRRPNGSWDLVEPSTEPTNHDAVNRLLETLANLPVLKTFDTPANDSERYRQYGLWSPKLTITVHAAERDHTLVFGGEAGDQNGSYCALQGKDEVFVTSSDAMRILSTELAAYRQTPGATNALK